MKADSITSIDLNGMSTTELLALKISFNNRIQSQIQQNKKAGAMMIEEIIAKLTTQFGISRDEILSEEKRAYHMRIPRAATGPVPIKHRNPLNPEETWTGRGRQPKWLTAYTKAGGDIEKTRVDASVPK